MTDDVAIRVEHLGKRFRIGEAKPLRSLREAVTHAIRSRLGGRRTAPGNGPRAGRGETFWALQDINFDVKRGECVGIIGRNGAGKSTLLKILSRITEPTEGHADIFGRVGSLLEVGTGFHPELTGRENTYLNGAILGMRKSEIARRFDQIVAFAEIERFIDTPVKHYSSGMYTRLAFAVAAHLEPEILIVDEVLAVGDAEFQAKCLGKMGDVVNEGRTVLFVSHNTAAVQSLCKNAILLHAGQIAAHGPATDVLRLYATGSQVASSIPLADRTDRQGTGRARATGLRILTPRGAPTTSVGPDEPVCFEVTFHAGESLRLMLSIDVDTLDGARVTTLFSGLTGEVFPVNAGQGKLYCHVEGLSLRPDQYALNVSLLASTEWVDFVPHAAVLEVTAKDYYGSGRLPERGHGPMMSRFHWTPQLDTAHD
ncbi:MAG: ABC transporter ATP-binding protein [Tepidisphaeraceae bacterium]